MRLKEIMETQVDRVAPAQTAEEAWNLMKVRRIHHLVVIEDGTVLGVLSHATSGAIAVRSFAKVERSRT